MSAMTLAYSPFLFHPTARQKYTVASCAPENTFSAMILLQASICWSAGVFSLVQSGPSCARDCAEAGGDHSAARRHAKSNAKPGTKRPIDVVSHSALRRGGGICGSRRWIGRNWTFFDWADGGRTRDP